MGVTERAAALHKKASYDVVVVFVQLWDKQRVSSGAPRTAQL